MAATEVAAPAERAEDEHDDGLGVCHLMLTGFVSLCGGKGWIAPAIPRFNCLGPVCDGVEGCGRRRCSQCATAWRERQVAGHR
jgi:hypothetical protein